MFRGLLDDELTKGLCVVFGVDVDLLNSEWKSWKFPVLLSCFLEEFGSDLLELSDIVHSSELVDVNVENEGVDIVLCKSGVVTFVEVLQNSLDGLRIFFREVDVRFLLFLCAGGVSVADNRAACSTGLP